MRAQPARGRTQKRLIGRQRTRYRKNDLSALLPIGEVESLALPGENYNLAFTPGLLTVFQAKAKPDELISILGSAGAGYQDLDGDGPFWVPSGRDFYSPKRNDSARRNSNSPSRISFSHIGSGIPSLTRPPLATMKTTWLSSSPAIPPQTRQPPGMATAYSSPISSPIRTAIAPKSATTHWVC